MKKVFLYWGFTAVIIALFSGMVYAAVQQDLRQTANDPQIEISEDLGQAMAAGADPANIGSPNFDLSQSLAPFVAVYDASGKVLAYNATLNANAPSMPSGIFDYTKQHGQDRFTWQPKPGVRQAVVVTYFNDKASGFVVVGRSLREIEKRTTKIGIELLIGMVFIWIVSFLMIWWILAVKFKLKSADVADQAVSGSEQKPPSK